MRAAGLAALSQLPGGGGLWRTRSAGPAVRKDEQRGRSRRAASGARCAASRRAKPFLKTEVGPGHPLHRKKLYVSALKNEEKNDSRRSQRKRPANH
jgi:hypothetical protein